MAALHRTPPRRWAPVAAALLLGGCGPADDDDASPAGDDDDSAQAGDDDDSGPTLEPALQAIADACAEPPTVPAGLGFDGLLNDGHVHVQYGYDHQEFALDLLGEMNAAGVDRAVVQSGHLLSQDWIRENDADWGPIVSVCPRLRYLLGGFTTTDDDAYEYVASLIDAAPYAGVGELDIIHVAGEQNDPRTPQMEQIYDLIEERGLTVHLQAPGYETEHPFVQSLHTLIAERPNLRVAWFGCYASEFDAALPDNLACVQFIHSESPNLGCCDASEEEDIAAAIVGSDAGADGYFSPPNTGLPYDNVLDAMLQTRERLGALDVPQATKDAIASGNFDRIYGMK